MIPKKLPDNDFNKKLVAKYKSVIKDGDFKHIIWDRHKKEFIVIR